MRIGIICTGDYQWAGGVYYSLSIIKLLQEISLSKKITVVAITNNATPKEIVKDIQLRNIKIVNLDEKSFLHKVFCKTIGIIRSIDQRFISDINALKLDILYPLIWYDKSHKKLNCKIYYWLYDFQHKFLPELFSPEEINKRELNFKNIIDNAEKIIVSSNDSKKHFNQFYVHSKAKVEVYNFVSLIERVGDLKEPELNIPDNYFIVCNQFWKHKNHITVIKAMDLLIKRNENVHIVFTGKNDGVANKQYVNELVTFIKNNKLNSHITFTGFISREQQIELIQNAKAVIQPSKFEGWSTVIEDVKALNKYLIASNIPVNVEQINENVLFFEPDDFKTLANHISFVNKEKTIVTKSNYQNNIDSSKLKLIELFKIE